MSDPLADKLAEILAREQITQEQMAQRIGVSTGYLSMVLTGKRGVGRKMLDSAASVFPELLAAHAASLTIRSDSVAKSPHGETDATRNLDTSTQRSACRTEAAGDSGTTVLRLR